jgi:hypothetical protein
MRRPLLHGSLAVLLAVGLAGCDNIDESIIGPPGPPPMITTTLAGSLALRGAETRTFEVIPTGQTVSITATITAITRQDAQETEEQIVVGMAMGTWNGATCQVILVNDNAFAGTTIVGTVSGYGMLCVRIYDVGRLEVPVNYSIDVVHPGQQGS